MPSQTVSLQESAYLELKGAKREKESFSETIHRLLAKSRPSFDVLAGALSAREAESVRRNIRAMRIAEEKSERSVERRWGVPRGRHGRHQCPH